MDREGEGEGKGEGGGARVRERVNEGMIGQSEGVCFSCYVPPRTAAVRLVGNFYGRWSRETALRRLERGPGLRLHLRRRRGLHPWHSRPPSSRHTAFLVL